VLKSIISLHPTLSFQSDPAMFVSRSHLLQLVGPEVAARSFVEEILFVEKETLVVVMSINMVFRLSMRRWFRSIFRSSWVVCFWYLDTMAGFLPVFTSGAPLHHSSRTLRVVLVTPPGSRPWLDHYLLSTHSTMKCLDTRRYTLQAT
jgi:hypothetical protein